MKTLLAIDVGAGTQDILLYDPDRPVENCVKLVLPSQTRVVAARVRRATAQRAPVFLCGNLMGGGACSSAVKAHLKAGLAVCAAPLAAKTLDNDLGRVEGMGVKLTSHRPEGAVPITTGDIDLAALAQALERFEVELPGRVAVAVQDHGDCPGVGNRFFRFRHWEEFVREGGDLTRTLHAAPPPFFTRMEAVQRDVPGALLMDTGPAAVWGALQDATVAERAGEGVVVLNIGNGHTFGVLVRGRRVWGLFEHHTGLIDSGKLKVLVDRLIEGTLTNAEVYDDGGHGCFIHEGYRELGRFAFVAVTGPNRRLARDLGYYAAVPHGDMMLSGCFGLVAAAREAGSAGATAGAAGGARGRDDA